MVMCDENILNYISLNDASLWDDKYTGLVEV